MFIVLSEVMVCAFVIRSITSNVFTPLALSKITLTARKYIATGIKKPFEPIPTFNISRLLTSLVGEEIGPARMKGTGLSLLKYPHPSLRAPNVEITEKELESGDISKIVKEMFLVMYTTGGIGLAAPQIGINKRLIVYNKSGDSTKWFQEVVMVNPTIVEFSETKNVENESCLSFPNMSGDIERPKSITVEALNVKGKKLRKAFFTGWESRILQHEYDHLNGVLYIDRLTEKSRKDVQPKLDNLIAKFGSGEIM